MRVSKHDQCFEGTKVRYFVYTPSGEVTRRAAFVCSMLCDKLSWDKVCRRLCDMGVLCVVMELPGFGTTPVNAPQDNRTRAGIFWGILDEVEGLRREEHCAWHLISHGSACGAIMEMARKEPDSVRSHTMISPVTGCFSGGMTALLVNTTPGRKLLKVWYKRMTGTPERFSKKITALYGQPVADARMQQLKKEFVRRGRFNTLVSMFSKGYFIHDKAYRAAGSVLLICGADDKVFGSGLGRKFEQLVADSRIEKHDVPGCAHMAMETHPEEVSDYLSGWFDFTEGRVKQPKRV